MSKFFLISLIASTLTLSLFCAEKSKELLCAPEMPALLSDIASRIAAATIDHGKNKALITQPDGSYHLMNAEHWAALCALGNQHGFKPGDVIITWREQITQPGPRVTYTIHGSNVTTADDPNDMRYRRSTITAGTAIAISTLWSGYTTPLSEKRYLIIK